MGKKHIFLVAVFFFQFFSPPGIYGEIYQYRDTQGILRFSDVPTASSEKIGPQKKLQDALSAVVIITDIDGKSVPGFFINGDHVVAPNKLTVFRSPPTESNIYESEKSCIEDNIKIHDRKCEDTLKRLRQNVENAEAALNDCSDHQNNIEDEACLENRKKYLASMEEEYKLTETSCNERRAKLENRREKIYAKMDSYKEIISATTDSGASYPARIVKLDEEKDVVLLKLKNIGAYVSDVVNKDKNLKKILYIIKSGKTGNSETNRIIKGDGAVYVSYPVGRLIRVYVKGVDDKDIGCPVVDENGRIVGMVKSVYPGFIHAVPINTIFSSFRDQLGD